MIHEAAEWAVFARWFRSRPARRPQADPRPIGASSATADGVAAGGADGGDPVFEGGGAVLLSPSHWEKAGWGVALLLSLAS